MIIARLLSALSVRTRIAVLALIPVAGFLANGVAYLSGEAEVKSAFESMNQAAGLADASREFNGAIATMGNAARDFVAGMTDRYAEREHRRLFDATPDLR